MRCLRLGLRAAVHLDQAREKAQVLRLMGERETKIIKGAAAVQALMKKYKLSNKDVLKKASPWAQSLP